MTIMVRQQNVIPDGSPEEVILSVERLTIRYPGRKAREAPPAVDDVSLALGAGRILALVGESGSGKSTLARAIAGLMPPLSGDITFAGRRLAPRVEDRSPDIRRRIQIIFQNPDASLNPRLSIGTILARPIELFFALPAKQRQEEVARLLDAVQLPRDYARRFPSELSGGERQRVAIARALAARPDILLCDEIVSALDVSVQATVLELLTALQRQNNLSLLFITHDLAVVRWFATHAAVLYRGRLCEQGTVEQLFSVPAHPYTSLLIDAAPGRKTPQAAHAPHAP